MGEAYLEAVLAAMWEAGEKMDDPDVIRRVLEAAGLPGEALLAATQDPEVKAELVANTEAAVARGVFGIPTFFVGDEMFFGKDRLGQVEEEAARQAAACGPSLRESAPPSSPAGSGANSPRTGSTPSADRWSRRAAPARREWWCR